MAERPGERRRFIITGTIDSLLEQIDGLTDAGSTAIRRVWEGEWAQATGSVIQVTANPENIAVSILLENRHQLFLIFDKTSIRAVRLCKNDRITVQGRIQSLLGGGFSLTDCEIISITSAAELLLEEVKARAAEPKESVSSTDPPAPTTSASEKPRLPDAALSLWHAAFKKAYPNGSQSLAEKSAIGAFPDHHVARSRIRELFPNSPRGRPKKNNDLDNSPESDGE